MLRKINSIVIHHSLSKTATVEEIRQWHLARGFSDIGYHFVIQPNGDVEVGRPLGQIGAHAKGRNEFTIGICLVGDFRRTKPTEKQYKSICDFSKILEGIVGHSLGITYHHEACPGPLFDRSRYA